MSQINLQQIVSWSALINGLLARAGGMLPAGLVWVMLAFGAGLLLAAVGFWLGGQEHPLAAVGFIVGSLAGMGWAVWLARWLVSGSLPLTV